MKDVVSFESIFKWVTGPNFIHKKVKDKILEETAQAIINNKAIVPPDLKPWIK